MKTLFITLFQVLALVFPGTSQITRTQIVNNAIPYTNFSWTASSCNLWNGTSCGGKNTYRAPWVGVGGNISMPYMWGGWSTISQHTSAMSACKSAGDVCSSGGGGCSGGGSGTNQQCASGHDCSGLVSRAWELGSKYGTYNLPDVSTEYSSISQLQPGDIVNIVGSHTRLITSNNGNSYTVIESSGVDWKCAYHTYTPVGMTGYTPLYYNNLAGGVSNDECNDAVQLTSNINCNSTSSTVNNANPDGFEQPSCDSYANPAGAGVFFRFTAVSSTDTIIVNPSSSTSSALDAVVVLYQGSNCFTLNEVSGGCEDTPGGGGETTTLTVNNLNVGQQYWIRVYDFGLANNTNGNFTICVTHENQPCNYSVNPSSQNFSSSANSGSFSVSAGSGCSWNATESCSWVTLNNASGTGNGSVNFTIQANPLVDERPCQITVNGETFTINQEGTGITPCTYTLNPSSGMVPGAGGSGSFAVNTQGGCNWSAVSSCGWITINTPSGTGNGNVSYTASINPDPIPRTCIITVNGQSYLVTQAAGEDINPCDTPLPPPLVNVNGCNLSTPQVSGADYQWFLNGAAVGNNSRFYTATQNGTYYVIVTDVNDCEAQSDDVFANCGPDVTDIAEEENQVFQIYPNPNNGHFVLSLNTPATKEKIYITLLDVTGKTVYTQTLPANGASTYEMKFNLAQGTYWLQFKAGNQPVISKKVVIAK